MTGVCNGAPMSFQFGNSSFNARVSMTAPDKVCAPTSEPFSTTHTFNSFSDSFANCFSLIAHAKPEGPAPIITTSYSIDSLSVNPYSYFFEGFPVLSLIYSLH